MPSSLMLLDTQVRREVERSSCDLKKVCLPLVENCVNCRIHLYQNLFFVDLKLFFFLRERLTFND